MADTHTRIGSGAPWEPLYGYCRVARAGNVVAVSGSAAVGPDGEVVGEGDMYSQTRRCLEVVTEALEKVGAVPSDVIRTRVFVTDISQWESVAKAHAAVFGKAPPTTSLVEVSGLIDPRMLVEIEADAIVLDERD